MFALSLTALCSDGLKVLVVVWGMLLLGDMISVNWRWRLPPGHFGLFMPLDQQGKKGSPILTGVADPDSKGIATI